MPRADLDGEKIRLAFAQGGSGLRFEEFFRRLLETERDKRHAGTTTVHGPTKFGVGDGGKDLILTVNEPPRIPLKDFRGQSLTWDDDGKTYYSLKTGTSWPQAVLGDVGYGEFLNPPKKRQTPKQPPAPPGTQLLEHMSAGNRYIVVTSEPADDGAKLIAKIVKALEYWLEHEGSPRPPNLQENIGFLSANELAAFVRDHHPILPEWLDQKLGLGWPEGLHRWEEWTRGFRRDLTDYVPDESRDSYIERIRDLGAIRVMRIFGPPGVGKTRLVHHALKEAGATDAVYYTDNADLADTVVRSGWLHRDAGPIMLVIDEVSSEQADLLTRDFLTFAHADAKLILIGVSDDRAREGLDRKGECLGVRLADLATDATRTLVERELGSPTGERESLVKRVLALADGYPWFAILLARALGDDDNALASGNDEANRWDAALFVLAGARSEHASDAEWRREAVIRAKCLLVVIMTGNQDNSWDELWSHHQEELRAVIDEPDEWARVKRAAADCVGREILRHVGRSNRRYVSPANLTRIILNHFFGGGPNDLGPRLIRHGAAFQGRVYAQAIRHGASEKVRDNLTRTLLTEFSRRVDAREPLHELLRSTDVLYAVAEREPDLAATTFTTAIRAHDRAQLAHEKELRHTLRGLFQELVQAPVSQSTFVDLEDALFAMARVEDERWSNNATGIWQSLFWIPLSQTHQPWAFRLQLLAERCQAGPSEDRTLALHGLAATVAARLDLGRKWPLPSDREYREYRERKREAWELLLRACESPFEDVADRARQIVAAKLRGYVMDDVAVDVELVAELSARVPTWLTAQRHQLAEALADIRRYDHEDLAPEPGLVAALDQLSRALQPSDFRERLVAQVGSVHPGPWAIDDELREQHEAEADATLAIEAIVSPHLITAEFEWLGSTLARRQRAFLRAVGRLDTERVLLSSLESFAASNPDQATRMLVWYVEGWSLAEDGTAADLWIDSQLGGGRHQAAASFVLPFLAPNDQRLQRIIEIVEARRAQPPAVVAMYRRWVEETSPVLMLGLLEAIGSQPELAEIGVSLSYELLNLHLDPKLRSRALERASALLLAATDHHLPSVREHDAERLISLLAASGRIDLAVEVVVKLICADVNLGHHILIERTLERLFDHGYATQIWAGAEPHLEGERGAALTWQLAHADILKWLEPDLVLTWVGDRESRAQLVAQLVNPYGSTLPEVARQLIHRFGAEGPVASTLSARAFSTPRAVASLTDFKRHQRENAVRWSEDEIPSVRRWAQLVADELGAQDEFRRKFA